MQTTQSMDWKSKTSLLLKENKELNYQHALENTAEKKKSAETTSGTATSARNTEILLKSLRFLELLKFCVFN